MNPSDSAPPRPRTPRGVGSVAAAAGIRSRRSRWARPKWPERAAAAISSRRIQPVMRGTWRSNRLFVVVGQIAQRLRYGAARTNARTPFRHDQFSRPTSRKMVHRKPPLGCTNGPMHPQSGDRPEKPLPAIIAPKPFDRVVALGRNARHAHPVPAGNAHRTREAPLLINGAWRKKVPNNNRVRFHTDCCTLTRNPTSRQYLWTEPVWLKTA